MRKLLFALLSVLLFVSCEEKQKTYLDREDSVYSTGADGIDQKVVLHRLTQQYEVYERLVIYDYDWQLVDKGRYKESVEGDIVTCELDNDYVKRNDDEKLGTIFRVKITLSTQEAVFSSISGKTYAFDITDKK